MTDDSRLHRYAEKKAPVLDVKRDFYANYAAAQRQSRAPISSACIFRTKTSSQDGTAAWRSLCALHRMAPARPHPQWREQVLKVLRTMLLNAFGLTHEEFGVQSQLLGYNCHRVTLSESEAAADQRFLYGEVAMAGVDVLLDARHLHAAGAHRLVEFGGGLGKFALQAFLQFPGLQHVVSGELSVGRYATSVQALCEVADMMGARLTLASARGHVYYRALLRQNANESHAMMTDMDDKPARQLEFRLGDMLQSVDVLDADILVAAVHIPDALLEAWCHFVCRLKPGSRLLTYQNVQQQFERVDLPFPFVRLPANTADDRVPTTWSRVKGWRFHLWRCVHLCAWQKLSLALLARVFAFLDAWTLLGRVVFVCRRWEITSRRNDAMSDAAMSQLWDLCPTSDQDCCTDGDLHCMM